MGPKDRNDGSAEINPCRRHDSTYRRALRMGDDELDSELDSTNRRARRWQLAGLDRLNMGILLFVTVVVCHCCALSSPKFQVCLAYEIQLTFPRLDGMYCRAYRIPSGHDCMYSHAYRSRRQRPSTTFPPPPAFPQGMTVCTVMPIVLVDNGLQRPSLSSLH